MTKAALYFRQSLDVQEGIERQRSRCLSLANAREWTVVGEYVDNDTSASRARGKGTAWARMLEDAAVKKFDIVVAVNLDRLLRTQKDLSALMDTGVLITTLEGELDLASASGEMQAAVLTAMARFETRRKGERQVRANIQAAEKGKPAQGRRAFGYSPDGMTIRDDEASAVKASYESFLAGVPLAQIARTLNAQGFTTTQMRYKGKRDENNKLIEPAPWTPSVVRDVLKNPRYVAKRARHGVIVADGIWPAIVDEATWLAVKATLANPARRRAPTRGRRLLSGLAVCGVCGSNVHAGAAARSGVPAYRCSGSMAHFARRAAPIEEYVHEIMIARLSRADAQDLLIDHKQPDLEKLRDERVGIRERLVALAIDFADDSLTASQLRAATERLRSRLDSLEQTLEDAGRVDVLGPLIRADNVRAAWDALEKSRQRVVIAVLAKISLYPVGRGVRTFNPESVGVSWLT